MKKFHKKPFPLSKIRRFLEPGPIVLASSAWKKESNIMTGLAHDDAIFPGSLRLLHLGWKSQLRDDSPKQGVCDQRSDR